MPEKTVIRLALIKVNKNLCQQLDSTRSLWKHAKHSSWLSKDTKQKTLLSIRSFVGKQTKKVKERRLFHQNLSHSMEQIRLSKLSTSALCLYAQKAFCYVCAKNSRIGSNSTKQQKNTFFHQDVFKIQVNVVIFQQDMSKINCLLVELSKGQDILSRSSHICNPQFFSWVKCMQMVDYNFFF